MSDARINIGDLAVDRGARVAAYAGTSIKCRDRTFDALVALVSAAPSIVSKGELAEAVWPGKDVSDETVAQRISLLRKALKSAGTPAPEVRNIHGRGYQLIVPAPSTAPEPQAFPVQREPKSPLRWLIAASVAGAGVFVMGLIDVNSAMLDPVKVLVDQNTGAVWIGETKDPLEHYPVFASVDERRVLINSAVDLEDVRQSTVALSVYCALAHDPALFETGVPMDLQHRLERAKSSEYCSMDGGA